MYVQQSGSLDILTEQSEIVDFNEQNHRFLPPWFVSDIDLYRFW